MPQAQSDARAARDWALVAAVMADPVVVPNPAAALDVDRVGIVRQNADRAQHGLRVPQGRRQLCLDHHFQGSGRRAPERFPSGP